MPHLFTDNFSGTGELDAHTPDLAPATFLWNQNAAGTISLDGAGKAIPDTVDSGVYRGNSTTDAWTPLPTGATFTVVFTARLPG